MQNIYRWKSKNYKLFSFNIRDSNCKSKLWSAYFYLEVFILTMFFILTIGHKIKKNEYFIFFIKNQFNHFVLTILKNCKFFENFAF